jgi:endonuclease/exonuclease/phosphatase family metal-dependent hydrolase
LVKLLDQRARLGMIVLTQNVWGGGPFWSLRRKSLARRIAQLRPDVIGLQEVHAPNPDGGSSQAHDLGDLTGGYQVIFAPGRVTPSGRCEGVAILSRHAIREHSVVSLSQDRDDVLDRFGPRVVLRAFIDLSEGPVDVFVTHLSVSRRARARTIHELLDFAARERNQSSSRGALLLGDLNAEPDEPIISALADGGGQDGRAWIDAWTSANGPNEQGGTWPAIAPFRRIDYILVQPAEHWEVHACTRIPRSGSDHLGVVARLGLV